MSEVYPITINIPLIYLYIAEKVVRIFVAFNSESVSARPKTVRYEHLTHCRTRTGSADILADVTTRKNLEAWFLANEILHRNVTLDFLSVQTRQHLLVDEHLAFATRFTTLLRALVIVGAEHLQAALFALVFFVIWIPRMAFEMTRMSAFKSKSAVEHATTFGSFAEIFRHGGVNETGRVILAAERQGINHPLLLCQVFTDAVPEDASFCHQIHVSYDKQTHFCPRQRNADTIVRLEESDLSLLVAANERQQDDVILLSLVVVDWSNANSLELRFRHLLPQEEHLSGVGREDGDLLRPVTLFQEVSTQRRQKPRLVQV